ncbi:uncharacterized protein LOC144700626 [Wolffia australiana]
MEANRGSGGIARKLCSVLRLVCVKIRRSVAAKKEREFKAKSFSCRAMEPERAYYCPREIEFSCSNTPADYPFYGNRRRRRGQRGGEWGEEAGSPSEKGERVVESSSGRGGGGGQVDREAEEFIRRFYEQLRGGGGASLTPLRRRREV